MWGQFQPSCRSQRAHPAQIQRQAHEFPLRGDAVQASHAELPEPQDVLDPSIGRFGKLRRSGRPIRMHGCPSVSTSKLYREIFGEARRKAALPNSVATWPL